MSGEVSEQEREDAVRLYLVTQDFVMVADQYGVETSDVADWLRSLGHPVRRGSLPRVRCKHGHRMMETRRQDSRGETYCLTCKRERGRVSANKRAAAERAAPRDSE